MIKRYRSQACLLLVGMLLFSGSCVRQSDMQTTGADFFQGEWVQDSIPDQDEMLHYTLHEFKVTCDSIYATFHVNSTVKNMPDSCFGSGSWTEYAKGVYVVRGDSLIVDGLYTKPNFKQKISGCYRSGTYIPRFKLSAQGADSVVLESRFDQRPIVLRKTADITCVPKRRWEY